MSVEETIMFMIAFEIEWEQGSSDFTKHNCSEVGVLQLELLDQSDMVSSSSLVHSDSERSWFSTIKLRTVFWTDGDCQIVALDVDVWVNNLWVCSRVCYCHG